MSIRRISTPKETVKVVDREEVYRAAAILFDPSHGVQIQALPSASHATIEGNDLDSAADAAERLAVGSTGIYFTLNPMDSALVEMAKNPDILRRRWLLIDIDAVREPRTNSTEEEHEAASEIAGRVQEWLWELGWPSPVVADSGNGFHLFYRIDLANDDDSRAVLKAALKTLAKVYDTDTIKIDQSVHDARRICKLPGTLARKGPHSADRPHRWAKLVHVPECVEVVPLDLLAKLSEQPATTPTPTVAPMAIPHGILKLRVGEDRRKAYARVAVENELSRIKLAPKGNKNNTINDACFRLGTLVGAGATDAGEVEAMACHAARGNGCFDDPASEKKTVDTIRRAIRDGMSKPRDLSFLDVSTNGVHTPATLATATDPASPIIIFASEVTTKKIEWLWPGRIPLGKLTTFAGPGGLGKTFVLTDITARVTRGEIWPDEAINEKAGNVLYVSGEDAPDDTLVPRLIACGGDRSKVAYLKPEHLGKFSLENIAMLDLAVLQLGNCRMVAIDPPTSFLCGIDDHKNAELRQVLTPLSEWATLRKIAVVFITHINKGGAGKVDAQMRIIGSVAWANAVRAAHLFVRDPDDDERRIFVGVKVNGGKERKGLAYKIEQLNPDEVDGPAKVIWLGEVDTSANAAMAGESKKKNRGERAAEWLIEAFRMKLEWAADDLQKEAATNGHNRNSLFEARKILADSIVCRRQCGPNGHVCWFWSVPSDWPFFGPKEGVSEEAF